MTSKESNSKELCPKPPSIFVREATGLVRSFSPFNAFLISLAVASPTIFSYGAAIGFIGGAIPGADFVSAENVGFLFSLPLAVTYFLLASVMPRSGGDYVWVSRLTHPAIGFMAGWTYWLSLPAFMGVVATVNASIVIPIFLVSLGAGLGVPSLIGMASVATTSTWILINSLILLAISYAFVMTGPKALSRLLIVAFAASMLSLFLSYLVLATSTHADFVNAVNGYAGTNATYDGIISQAKSAGWSFVTPTLGAALLGAPFGVELFSGFNYSAAVSGEVRNVKRGMLYGIVAALAAVWLLDAIGTWLTVNVVGNEFLQATLFLGPAWPIPALPWTGIFVSMLTHNSIILVLTQIGWLLTFIWWMPAFVLISSRYIFAFSFDRVVPTRFADVDERFHSPLKALALNLIITVIFVFVATYTSWLSLILNSTVVWVIMWLLASVAAIALPYKKPDIAKSLPGSSWKIPLIAILGALNFVVMALTLYFAVITPAVGPTTPLAYTYLAVVFLSGVLVYAAGYFYNRRHGLSLNMVYAEIPPE
jgi:basic amino acid/polyamine antiporter, APA family